MKIIKCITFDKDAQDALPQHIKDKMNANMDKAREENKNKGLNIPCVNQQRELLLAFCDHLNTYAGMEEIRFDFMMQDFIDKSQ